MVNLKELYSNFVFGSTDKTVNNVAIICKRFFELVIAKKLRFNSGIVMTRTVVETKLFQIWKII